MRMDWTTDYEEILCKVEDAHCGAVVGTAEC